MLTRLKAKNFHDGDTFIFKGVSSKIKSHKYLHDGNIRFYTSNNQWSVFSPERLLLRER